MARRSASAWPAALLLRAALGLAASHIGIHRAAHNGTRPHDRHLHGEVFEIPGPGPADHLDLRPALDLEQPHRVTGADAVVDHRVVEVDA
jgi:hypothetical protein